MEERKTEKEDRRLLSKGHGGAGSARTICYGLHNGNRTKGLAPVTLFGQRYKSDITYKSEKEEEKEEVKANVA